MSRIIEVPEGIATIDGSTLRFLDADNVLTTVCVSRRVDSRGATLYDFCVTLEDDERYVAEDTRYSVPRRGVLVKLAHYVPHALAAAVVIACDARSRLSEDALAWSPSHGVFAAWMYGGES